MPEQINVKQVDYHRNGVSGEGFYAVIFETSEGQTMLGVVFPPGDNGDDLEAWTIYERGSWHNPRVAVFDANLLPDVGFGVNSWRGDNYAAALYTAIIDYKQYEDVIKGGRTLRQMLTPVEES
jgi:hypothetical protein